jgi:hypothetical protein
VLPLAPGSGTLRFGQLLTEVVGPTVVVVAGLASVEQGQAQIESSWTSTPTTAL